MTLGNQGRLPSDEARHNAINQVCELQQQWDDRLRLDDLRLIDRYNRNRLVLHVHFCANWRDVRREYCAVVHRNDVRLPFSTPNTLTPDALTPHVWCPDEIAPVTPMLGNNQRHEQTMLIDDVEFVQCPNGVISSLVWLQQIDRVHLCLRQALYSSVFFGCVFVGVGGNGEPMLARPVHRRWHQDVHEMIKGGAEVVEDVSDFTEDWRRDLLMELCAVSDALRGVRINLLDQGVRFRVGTEEGIDAAIEVTDVLFGPFNLDPRIALPMVTHNG